MLYAPDKLGEAIPDVPRARREQYRIWRGRLSQAQYDAIADHLNERIDGAPIHTAGWMPPGEKWDGTVFEPILSVACRGNRDAAGKCFGLILWEVMIRREDDWSFGRFERDGVPIESMTYFHI